MELGSAWIGYAAAWLSTAALVVLANHLCRRRKHNLPPGPKSWPVIGNLDLIGSLPHRSIHDLSLKYGPIMQLRFGSFPVVVGSSAEMAKIFLKTMDINFLDRPKTAAGKYTAYNYSDMTWSQYGPYWRQARRMCAVELFSTKRLDSYEYIRSEELKSILYNLYERSCSSPGQPIILKDYLSTLSLNIISRMVLGKNYLKQSNDIVSPEEFKKMIEEWFVLNGVLDIGDSIPWIAFMDVQGNVKKMKALGKRFDRFLKHVLEDHIDRMVTEGDKFVAMDMVDVLLQLADDPSNEVKIGRDGVKGFTQDLLTGGTESSAMTVEWAMSELLKNPETLMKAIKELDRVIGKDQWVEEKDMLNLPYIQAIVKETMRLHPVAPMLAPHQCREDSKVAGYDVPKGTRVLVNVWTIGRDPTLWDNPNEFIPDRFIGKKIDVKGGDFELLPFGAGRRMCPGYSLGLKAIQASLANFLHGFKWTLPDGVAPYDLNMEETFGLSTPKKFPLFVVIESRLPMHLYSTFGPSKKK